VRARDKVETLSFRILRQEISGHRGEMRAHFAKALALATFSQRSANDLPTFFSTFPVLDVLDVP
jgi:hypothetical protein